MKLCTKCKHLHNDEDAVCSNCNSPLESITDENTPVYLLSAEGFELERVKTALEDNSIPCDSVIKDKQLKKQEFINKNLLYKSAPLNILEFLSKKSFSSLSLF